MLLCGIDLVLNMFSLKPIKLLLESHRLPKQDCTACDLQVFEGQAAMPY